MTNSIQKERLDAYLDAEKKTLKSQEYQEGSRRNRRAGLNDIGKGINELLSAGAAADDSRPVGRARRVVFRDL